MKQKRFGLPGSLLCCSIILGASLVASNTLASTITSWNEIGFTNLAPDEDPDLGFYTGSSAYISDGNGDGISVTNAATAADKSCITSAGTTCSDPRKSGKRIKISATDNGPIDLVFNLDSSVEGSTGEYTVASKILNRTGTAIENVTLELGFGSGDNFFSSTADDGVDFLAGSAFSKFSHGLFGAKSEGTENLKHEEDGFYDSSISGFTLNDITADKIESDGIFGYYGDYIGSMLDIDQVPDGSFIPAEIEGEEDLLVRAPDPENPGEWLYRDGWNESIYDGNFEKTEGFYYGEIEDLAQANFTFSILTGDFNDASFWSTMTNMQGLSLDEDFYNTFTLRITTTAAPVPEPATMLLFGIGLAGLAGYRQKQKK